MGVAVESPWPPKRCNKISTTAGDSIRAGGQPQDIQAKACATSLALERQRPPPAALAPLAYYLSAIRTPLAIIDCTKQGHLKV
jgi:hypothetical protein